MSRKTLLKKQFDDARKKHNGLCFLPAKSIIMGHLQFDGSYQNITLGCDYDIEITIPNNYPNEVPNVKEIGGVIPRNYHTYPDTGNLCLGSPLAVKREFLKVQSILGFIDNLLAPYLFSFTYFQKYKVMPFGELVHGFKGLLVYYMESFGTKNVSIILHFLNILASGNYEGNIPCPCGSGPILERCHGSILREMMKLMPPKYFFNEYRGILVFLYCENAIGKYNILSP